MKAAVKQISPEKIIHVYDRDETNKPEPCFKVVETKGKFCPHERLNIFKHHREVFCTDCGAKLEAFDALVSMARKDNNCISEMQWRKYELKRANDEKDALEKNIKNLKSQKAKLIKHEKSPASENKPGDIV